MEIGKNKNMYFRIHTLGASLNLMIYESKPSCVFCKPDSNFYLVNRGSNISRLMVAIHFCRRFY